MSHPLPPDLVVPARFRGPPSSGNGGWSAGAVAAHATTPAGDGADWPAATVVLRRPPPLDTTMTLEHAGPVSSTGTAAVRLSHDGAEVLTARPAEQEPAPVAPVDDERARAAAADYAGHRSHPFPTCFVCGTARAEGDGLRIFPGRVDDDEQGRARVAAPWTPHPSLAEDWHEYAGATRRASYAATWAALDCAGAWAGDLEERLMVLGTMTARVHTLPEVGVEHVVVGGARGGEGRKSRTAASLYAPDGTLVGTAEHVWIAVDPALFA